MKAYIRNKSNVMLSIGMIVKNEEKNLARCLDSLKPLLDAVPCEIIIADTGSTDHTMEIASRYTDKAFRIEWQDNFAAARNTTVERANGEWFMYMDADNWFVDLEDMVAFFQNNSLRETYDCGAYTVYNFVDADLKRYHVTHDYRIVRNFPGLRFYGRIHEHLPYGENCYQFKSTTYHTGYVGENTNKAARNIPLLEQAIAEGDDEQNHLYFQLAREYSSLGQIEKAGTLLQTGIALKKEGRVYLASLHHYAANCLAQKKWDEALTSSRNFLKTAPVGAGKVAMHNIAGQACYRLGQFEEACTQFEAYIPLYEKLSAGILDTSDSMWCPMLLCGKRDFQEAMGYYALCLAKIERRDDFLQLLEKTPLLGTKELLAKLAEVEASFVEWIGDADHYLRRYLTTKSTKDQGRMEQLQEEIEKARKSSPQLETQIAAAFAEHTDQSDNYCRLMRLRNYPDDLELLQSLLKEAPPYVGFAELLDYAIQKNVNFLPFIERIDRDDLSPFMSQITVTADEIAAYYKSATSPMFPCALRWKCALLEKALFETPQIWEEIFGLMREGIARLVTWIYGEEMPADDVLVVIPRGHRFGLYLRESERWEQKGDPSESLRMLACAGEAYPVMLAVIKNILEKRNSELARLQALEDESRSVEGVIKQKIRYMIHQGDLKNAKIALEGYAKLRPSDPDLGTLQLQVLPAGIPS